MLEGAIRDVAVGTSSDFGYAALFKKPVNVLYVKAMLQKIVDGDPMPVQIDGEPGSRPPVFVCPDIKDEDPTIRRFYDMCPDRGNPILLIPNTPWVVLCPQFFRMKEAPETRDCPTMALTGGAIATPFTMIANQRSAVVRQLAHFYLGKDDLQPEVTRLSDIFVLSEDRSKRNAQSYGIYAASKI